MPNSYLCIGHLCHDVGQNGYLLGGTVAYASHCAKKWGKQVKILTSVGQDFEYFNALDAEIVSIPAEKTTLFENIYENDKRIQYLHHIASSIHLEDIPKQWKSPEIVHICPIADEVDYNVLAAFPNSLIGVTPQGWLRDWQQDKKVFPKAMDWQQLSYADVVIMSDADLEGIEDSLPTIIAYSKILILTHGAKGVDVFTKNKKTFYSSFSTQEVDPTGAGDVFATAFFIKFAENPNVGRAIAFAHAAASLSIEQKGLAGITDYDVVEKRMEKHLSTK